MTISYDTVRRVFQDAINLTPLWEHTFQLKPQQQPTRNTATTTTTTTSTLPEDTTFQNVLEDIDYDPIPPNPESEFHIYSDEAMRLLAACEIQNAEQLRRRLTTQNMRSSSDPNLTTRNEDDISFDQEFADVIVDEDNTVVSISQNVNNDVGDSYKPQFEIMFPSIPSEQCSRFAKTYHTPLSSPFEGFSKAPRKVMFLEETVAILPDVCRLAITQGLGKKFMFEDCVVSCGLQDIGACTLEDEHYVLPRVPNIQHGEGETSNMVLEYGSPISERDHVNVGGTVETQSSSESSSSRSGSPTPVGPLFYVAPSTSPRNAPSSHHHHYHQSQNDVFLTRQANKSPTGDDATTLTLVETSPKTILKELLPAWLTHDVSTPQLAPLEGHRKPSSSPFTSFEVTSDEENSASNDVFVPMIPLREFSRTSSLSSMNRNVRKKSITATTPGASTSTPPQSHKQYVSSIAAAVSSQKYAELKSSLRQTESFRSALITSGGSAVSLSSSRKSVDFVLDASKLSLAPAILKTPTFFTTTTTGSPKKNKYPSPVLTNPKPVRSSKKTGAHVDVFLNQMISKPNSNDSNNGNTSPKKFSRVGTRKDSQVPTALQHVREKIFAKLPVVDFDTTTSTTTTLQEKESMRKKSMTFAISYDDFLGESNIDRRTSNYAVQVMEDTADASPVTAPRGHTLLNSYAPHIGSIRNYVVESFPGLSDRVKQIDISPLSSRYYAVVGYAHTVISIRQLRTNDEYMVLLSHSAPVTAVAFSPNDKYVATGGMDGLVVVHDVNSGGVPLVRFVHPNAVTCLHFSASSNQIVSGCKDKYCRVWHVKVPNNNNNNNNQNPEEGPTLISTFTDHSFVVSHVKFVPKSQWVVSGGGDNIVMLWNAVTAATVSALVGHVRSVEGIEIHEGGRSVVTLDSTDIRLWEIPSGILLKLIRCRDITSSPDVNLTCLCLLPSMMKDIICVGTSDGFIHFVSLGLGMLDLLSKGSLLNAGSGTEVSSSRRSSDESLNLFMPQELSRSPTPTMLHPQSQQQQQPLRSILSLKVSWSKLLGMCAAPPPLCDTWKRGQGGQGGCFVLFGDVFGNVGNVTLSTLTMGKELRHHPIY